MRGGSRSGMTHGMSLHTTGIYRPYICASHSLTHSDTCMLDSDIDRGQQLLWE